jgi:hypothetical protein
VFREDGSPPPERLMQSERLLTAGVVTVELRAEKEIHYIRASIRRIDDEVVAHIRRYHQAERPDRLNGRSYANESFKDCACLPQDVLPHQGST